MSMLCRLCPRQCAVDRTQRVGACKCFSDMKITRIAPHFYEEPPISGTRGSGTIFFSGCSLNCEFCQNHEISKSYVGKTYSPSELTEAMKQLEESGAHNINLVTPTHFSNKIREALDIFRPSIPIVYNTSGYELPSVIEELLPYVDVFLFDMKYADDSLAARFSQASDYVRYCRESLSVAVDNKPLLYDGELLRRGVIVRHLVLPGHLDNSLSVVDYFAENLSGKAILSVMSQFFPTYRSTITRTLSPLEYKIVINRMEKRGVTDAFIQELSSATSDFVPDFHTDTD